MDRPLLAHFILQGISASQELSRDPKLRPADTLPLSPEYDLADLLPMEVTAAFGASAAYRYLFVFENYLRTLVVDVLTKLGPAWWDLVPEDVRGEVGKLEEMEETKRWMALGSRDRSALLTYPQLIRVIDANWKPHFMDLVRDKALLHSARALVHSRNTIGHMSNISDEELDRVRQTMRDWFRMVAP
jgi:hypothetical protein